MVSLRIQGLQGLVTAQVEPVIAVIYAPVYDILERLEEAVICAEVIAHRFLQHNTQAGRDSLLVEILQRLAGICDMARITAGKAGTDDRYQAWFIQVFQCQQCKIDVLVKLLFLGDP